MLENKNVLKGVEWLNYLKSNNWRDIPYLKLYAFTYKHVQVFKVGEYYFTLGIKKGYKNASKLKACIV